MDACTAHYSTQIAPRLSRTCHAPVTPADSAATGYWQQNPEPETRAIDDAVNTNQKETHDRPAESKSRRAPSFLVSEIQFRKGAEEEASSEGDAPEDVVRRLNRA
jgi:hypothetical protein